MGRGAPLNTGVSVGFNGLSLVDKFFNDVCFSSQWAGTVE